VGQERVAGDAAAEGGDHQGLTFELEVPDGDLTAAEQRGEAHAEGRAGQERGVGAELFADRAVAGAGEEETVVADDHEGLELPLLLGVLQLVVEGAAAVGATAGTAFFEHPGHLRFLVGECETYM
tara:strand:- start:5573 stop:5947 length:375 start_codon:yes stop_codon:yes gene_type:complete